MKEYRDSCPKNSRIKIDYSEKHPKVMFQFPNKKKQYNPDRYILYWIFMVFNYINVPVFFLFVYGFSIKEHIIFLVYVGITPFIIFLFFKNKLRKIYPDFKAFIASKKKLKIFSKKDILEFPKDTFYCEIPLFDNILCDYEATGEFSKYLKYFEIREYDFNYIERKNEINEWIWYARFYFSAKPSKGQLKVIFK